MKLSGLRSFPTALIAAIASFLLVLFLPVHRSGTGGRSDAMPPSLKAGEAFRALAWYNDQRAYPTGHIPEGWKERALAQIARKTSHEISGTASELSWVSIGPGNIGGRIRSIAINPLDPNIMYVGSVSGGIFKTTNGGASWTPITDFAQNLVIGTIALDPVNPDIIYAGTGEGYFNFDAMRGIGVLKSTNAGATWTVLNNFPGAPAPYSYYFINKLIVRPDNPSVLLAATVGGIWRSTNSGTSWSLLNTGSRSNFCTDLVMSPASNDMIYASFGLFSPDGVYRSTNGGNSWSRVSTSFPASGFGRISLAIAPSNPLVLYASISDSLYYTHSIRKSIDGGTSWVVVTTPIDTEPTSRGSHLGGQGWFNNVIAVHPTAPNTVFAGGINNFRSTDGGSTWGRISNGYGLPFVHVDQHAIAFHPTVPTTMFFGNDGGIFKSTDGGLSFASLNNGLPITQFYSGAAHPSSDIYFGGTQDNGTLRSSTPTSWNQVLGGDGGYVAVDRDDPRIVFTTYVYLSIFRSSQSGDPNTWGQAMTGIPQQSGSIFTSDRCNFIAPLVMDPSNSQVLVAGSYRVFRTTNSGASWWTISGDLTGSGDGANQLGQPGSTITALAIAKSASQTIYVGTSGYSQSDSARVVVTTNTGSTWTNVTRSNMPNRQVKAIAINPANASHAYVVYSGYNASTPSRPGHVFMTTNRGITWSNVSGDLPDIPVNTIVIDSALQGHLAIGTDLGVFETFNGGVVWNQRNSGMANVAVAELFLRPNGHLVAATHGRSMFRSALPFRGATATTLSIIIHQNPLLARYLDLYVTATDSFTTEPTLTLTYSGGSPQSVPLSQLSYRVQKGSHEVTAGGILTLAASATDSAGETISAGRTLAVALTKQGEGSSLQAADGRVRLDVPAGAMSRDGLLTIIPEEDLPGFDVFSGVYEITSSSSLGAPVRLAFNYDPASVPADRESQLRLLRKEGNTWTTVDGVVDRTTYTVAAEVSSLGRYVLGLGDVALSEPITTVYSLGQNYPNPFNPSTTIRFSLPGGENASLKVYNMLGQEVASLFEGTAPSGEQEIVWNGRDASGNQVSSGVYFCRLVVREGGEVRYTGTRKMLLMK